MHFFFKNNEVKVSFKHFKLNGSTLKSIYVVGFPSVIMQSIGSVMIIGLNAILAVSEAAVTVLGIYYKLQSFVFMPCFGLNQGVMPIIGYNYGARKKKRMYSALKRGIIIGVIIMAVGTILMWTIPEQLIAMFGGTQDIMDIGVPAFRIISLCFIPAAAALSLQHFFRRSERDCAVLLCHSAVSLYSFFRLRGCFLWCLIIQPYGMLSRLRNFSR